MNQSTKKQPACYRPSGKVKWSVFLPLATLTLLVAAVSALGMARLFQNGSYHRALPFLASALCGGFVLMAIAFGHCRSPAAAVVLGISATLVLNLGYYHAGMISSFGPAMIKRLDLLPKYIAIRNRTDASKRSLARRAEPELDAMEFGPHVLLVPRVSRAHVIGNWLLFATQLGIIGFLLVGAALVRTRRAYCENCGRWLKMDQRVFPYGLAKNLADTVARKDYAELEHIDTIIMPMRGSYTSMALEHCAADEGALPCPAYLSIKNVRVGGGLGQFNQFEAAIGRTHLRQRLLSAEQSSEISRFFPRLAAFPEPVVDVTAEESDLRQRGKRRQEVDVTPIEDFFAGRILSKRVIWIGNALSLLILPLFFGSVALALGGGYLCTRNAKQQGWPPLLTDYAPFLVAIGIPLIFVVYYISQRCPGILGQWYLRRHAKNEIRSRPDWIVDPDDADAMFVQIVPRSNWGRMMLETATDVGFLRIDEENREILFEGDKERYRIPAGAIVSCDVASIIYGEGTPGRTIQYTTVLRARGPNGFWENPIGQRGDFGVLGTQKRLLMAKELRERILKLQE